MLQRFQELQILHVDLIPCLGSSVWWYFIFLRRWANCLLLMAFLMLRTQRWDRAKVMLMLDHRDSCSHISVKTRNCFLHLSTQDLADVSIRWLGMTLPLLEQWLSAVVLDCLCGEFCNSRLAHSPSWTQSPSRECSCKTQMPSEPSDGHRTVALAVCLV